ncbi:enoyl-CoA hydratase [Chelatococcus reniformis]|uniref:Enoyl-CoA hydratase n=1 Tax=Chelatococcus reniformis TaxID=1494448 RepID=A0A916XQB3_9HYPH|nr:enoyl-CoA hydratase [Chelatococcus reniformis]GGC92090.1 enoyl-CoA hydratase [Chelatococcus reniformis]
MTYEHILYSVDDRVATITLNRPDKLNAWTGTMEKEMRQAVENAADDAAVRAIVITGAGRGFCAGADMTLLSGITAGDRPAENGAAKAPAPASNSDFDANFERRFSYLLRLPKPVIAAINGPIAGMGVCMSMFCDFRYMADSAKLTTAFARRGLIAEHGISWMLPKLVGVTNALDLLLSARTATPPELERMGLVRVLPDEDFLAAVQGIARDLVTNSSPRSIGVMKRQVYEGLFQSLDGAWAVADEEMVRSFDSEDFKEGVAHFLEKRAPAFTGR